MSKVVELNIAKKPQQQRSREKVAAVRKAAEKIILAESMEACTIAALSRKTGYPRATIYMFYPNPLAVLNDLATLHLTAMQDYIKSRSHYIKSADDWRDAFRRHTEVGAQYFRDHPVAAKVVLGPLSDVGYQAWENAVMSLGTFVTAVLDSRQVKLRPSDVNLCALVVEYGASTFRHAYYIKGDVTKAYEKIAAEAAIALIEGHVQ